MTNMVYLMMCKRKIFKHFFYVSQKGPSIGVESAAATKIESQMAFKLNGWNQKQSDGHPQGCLLGKYKPFGIFKKVLAWKKNLKCQFLQIHYYTKNQKKNLKYASNHKKNIL